MSRRSAVEQIVIEEKKVTESIFKLISAREKASAWHLKWAKFEEHHFLFFLFGKLAELRWIWNDLLNRFVDRHQEYYKTFKDIHYEERVIEDTKKTLQTCESSIAKLRKQMDSAQKRNDSSKMQTVERELTSQTALQEHLNKNINSRSERLSQFKVEQIQKGLLIQAQAGIQMAEQLRHLFIAQLRIADIVGNQTLTTAVICQMVSQVIIGLSNTLGIFPPPTGNVDPLPSPSESPTQCRKSASESSPLPSPLGFTTSTEDKRGGRRSFPFPYRPLPQEPMEADHPPQSHAPPTHKGKGVAFTRSASDVPLREHKSSRSPNHTYRASLIILEESQRAAEMPQARSQSVSRASSASSLKDPATIQLLEATDANHSILKSPPPNQLILKQDSSSSLDPGKVGPLLTSDNTSLGSESDPGYADPIDALREYYSSQQAQKGPGAAQEDLSNGPEISDPPYQTLAQIQERRQWQVLQDTMQNPEDDPTYSKPFDCLVGLAAPIRVTSETAPSRKLSISPLAMHRTISPDFSRSFPKSGLRRHAIRRHPRKPSGSEETLSSSPSPEPDTAGLLRPHNRCGSLDSLLNTADDFSLVSGGNTELRERVKSTGNLLEDKPIKVTHQSCRGRIRSLGNLLGAKGSFTFAPRPTSPLALTRVISDQDVVPRSSSSSIVSPQPSPLHVPVPAEVTRFQNGYATVVHPEYS